MFSCLFAQHAKATAVLVAAGPDSVATKTPTATAAVPPPFEDNLPNSNILPGSLLTNSSPRPNLRGTSRSSERRPPDGHARSMASIERYDKEFPKLKDFNLYAATTSGAGNCLFHALSDQVRTQTLRWLFSLSPVVTTDLSIQLLALFFLSSMTISTSCPDRTWLRCHVCIEGELGCLRQKEGFGNSLGNQQSHNTVEELS